MTTLHDLHQSGQSTWLNYLRDSFIRSGELAERIEAGVQGITANIVAYRRAIGSSSDYDAAIARLVEAGTPVKRIHEALMVDDIQRAADLLHPVFEATEHRDGFVSMELEPAALHDVVSTVAEVRRLSHHVDRYNTMVEIPATPTGIEAITRLVADGVSVNATHLFSVDDYERVAHAYIAGLDEYISSHSVWRVTPTAVASFSLSPIDSAVDAFLDDVGQPELKGKAAVAMATLLYERFQAIFQGEAWEQLAERRGRPLRPKWTRTTPRDFAYPDTYYVNQLALPDTVFTFSPATLNAFLSQPRLVLTPPMAVDAAAAHLEKLAALGLDMDDLAASLRRQHLLASDRQFQEMIQTVIRKRDELDTGWQRMTAYLGPNAALVEEGLDDLCHHRVICRIWSHDHTVWKPEPTEITNRLGWLHIMDTMADKVGRLEAFTQQAVADGFTHALLLGMGGSSLAPELFQNTLGRPSRPLNLPFPYLDLVVLDTTDADAVLAAERSLDLARTLVIVATKSGGTVETLSAFKYFYNRLAAVVGAERAGSHFVGITDPGSKIVDLAGRYHFRDLFLNDPNIGGRYSALSYFGLVAAALVGVDLRELLERAAGMAADARLCDCHLIRANDPARLGTILGRLALAGRDKVTFITPPALASFGDWAEQLIAESTGKEGKGILPVVGEPLRPAASYGDDRLFIHLRLEGDVTRDEAVAALVAAGQPVVTIRLRDLYDIGGQFVMWELATAVAGYFLQINPFDQPNVESAKVKARAVVAAYAETGALPGGGFADLSAEALQKFLNQAETGDYVAIQAYVPATRRMDEALLALRQAIAARTGLATTVGYGPRFLHSTGQLHKGDRGNGLFIQFVSEAAEDVPIPDEAGQPGSSISFDVLKHAQALGDAQALRDARRRVIAFDAGGDPAAAVAGLAESL